MTAVTPDRLKHLASATRAIAIDFQGVMFVDRPTQVDEDEAIGQTSLVARLADLLMGHRDIAVVVTSSWRAQLDDDQLLEQLPGMEPWYVGSVGQPNRGRDEALRDWLAIHRQITRFVVLDDQPRLYRGSWPELIVFQSTLGLNDPAPWQRLVQWVGESRDA